MSEEAEYRICKLYEGQKISIANIEHRLETMRLVIANRVLDKRMKLSGLNIGS